MYIPYNKNIYKSVSYLIIGSFAGLLSAVCSADDIRKDELVYKEVKEATVAFSTDLSGLMNTFESDGGLKEPLIFRGAALQWPAMKWSPEWFAEHCGDLKILERGLLKTKKLDTTLPDYHPDMSVKLDSGEGILLSDFLQMINCLKSGKPAQLIASFGEEAGLKFIWQSSLTALPNGEYSYENHQKPSMSVFPLELEKDLRLHSSDGDNSFLKLRKEGALSRFLQRHEGEGKNREELFADYIKENESLIVREAQAYFKHIFIASKNNITDLHVDNPAATPNVIAVQLHGRKQWVMIPPEYNDPKAGLFDEKGSCLLKKKFDMTQPALLRSEDRLSCIPIYSVILNSGDILLMPKNWSHSVKALDISVSVHGGISSLDMYNPSPSDE